MNGPNELSTPMTVDDRLNELEEHLNRVEASLSLPARTSNYKTEATDMLEYDRQTMRSLTAEESQESAIILQGYAFYLQRQENRFKSIAGWCDENLNWVIADLVGEAKGFEYKERRPLAIKNSVAATKLTKVKTQVTAEAVQLSYLSQRVEFMARQFENLARIKNKQHG